MRNISAWAIRSPLPTVLLFLALTLAGCYAFASLPVNLSPDTSFPVAVVTIADPGTTAGTLEQTVTRPIEDAVAGLGNVRHIRSTVVDGDSTTTVEFQMGVTADDAVNAVRDAVARVRGTLPAGIVAPLVSRLEVDGGAILSYAVRSRARSALSLSRFIDNTLRRELLSVSGVGRVTRLGGARQEMHVALDPVQLEARGVTAAQVDAQLQVRDVDRPGGQGEIGGQQQAIRTLGSASSLAALAATGIALPNGGWVRLDQLGALHDGAAERRQAALFDNHPVVAFSVFKAKGASAVTVAGAVARRLHAVGLANPDLSFVQIASTVAYTRASYAAAMHTLIEGLSLASLVVLCFLRDWRIALLAALAMPLSLAATFAGLFAFGFTLNAITLLALALVVGVLVDDAIVEIENIVRHAGRGIRPYRAAIEAADEIGLAVVATSATIMVVFLPVSLMTGVVGQYFKQFGVTVALAVMASLLVARLLTPMLAAYFLHPQPATRIPSGWLGRYRALLHWALSHRRVVLGAGAVLVVGSLALLPLLPTGFLPIEDQGRAFLSVDLPPGSSIGQTMRTVERITSRLLLRPDVAHVFTAIGEGGPFSGGEVTHAALSIDLKPPNERQESTARFQALIRPLLQTIPDIRWRFTNGGGDPDVSIVLTGARPDAVARMARILARQMRRLDGLQNVQTTIPLGQPEILMRPRPDFAASLGVSTRDIAETARIATSGNAEARLAAVRIDGRRVPIRVALAQGQDDRLAAIQALRVPGTHGNVPLDLVAQVGFGDGAARIQRFDRQAMVAVQAGLGQHVTLGSALREIHALPVFRQLAAAGVHEQPYGAAEYMGEMFSQFAMASLVGVLMLIGVLLLLFRQVLQAFTVLTALPLSICGALSALLVTGQALDLSSFIGLLMLMGIVTKNSILLVDAAIEAQRAGLGSTAALMQAGAQRARPIVMTTIAMVAGMLPAAFGIGAGAAFRQPMAIAVIGGLLSSTVLSLVFVPVFYSVMAQADRWLRPLLLRLTTLQPGEIAAGRNETSGRIGL